LCDPITLGLTALAGGAALFGGGNDAPPPPPPVIPARPPSAARDPDAEVRIGDGTAKNSALPTPEYDGFTTKRVTGKPLGGLGRGGLGL
jgi:hypothetical protein